MSQLIRKQHNVSVLLYHIVCPAKYRKVIFTPDVDEKLKEICADIALRYEIEFLEIGTDQDHVHFLVQSVPKYSPTEIVRTIKSITAKEIFRQMPEVRKKMWGGEFWSDGYFISTVGSHARGRNVKAICQKSREDESEHSTFAFLMNLLAALPRGDSLKKFDNTVE